MKLVINDSEKFNRRANTSSNNFIAYDQKGLTFECDSFFLELHKWTEGSTNPTIHYLKQLEDKEMLLEQLL